jgi:CRP-like cAMP-binding protein
MQADLLPFIDWTDSPRRICAAQERIIAAGDPTDTLLLLESGVAEARGAAIWPIKPAQPAAPSPDIRYEAGALLSMLEMLSLDAYRNDVVAIAECRLISINRSTLKAMWDQDNHLAWPLSCSIAASITQNRQVRWKL